MLQRSVLRPCLCTKLMWILRSLRKARRGGGGRCTADRRRKAVTGK